MHSDPGCQYTSDASRAVPSRHGFGQSMGRIGDCIDNALAEPLFAHCKREVLTEIPLNVVNPARRLSSGFDDECDHVRSHSALGNLSAMQFSNEGSPGTKK